MDERIARQHILPFLGERRFPDLTREIILEWLGGFDSRNFAISTRNRILCVMKSIFKVACEREYLDALQSPLSSIHCAPEKRQETVSLSEDEIGRLMARLKEETRPEASAIALLLLTGASKNEILMARWEHFDAGRGILAVRAQSGRERSINLNADALAIIESLERLAGSPWLFPGRSGNRPISHIFPFWNKIRKECGLQSVRIQDLRYALGHETKKGNSPRTREEVASGDFGHSGVMPLPGKNHNGSGNNGGVQMPVAIIGMGMRFPGNVHDEASMWNILKDRKCAITRIPDNRWPVEELSHPARQEQGRSVTFSAGVLEGIDQFDAAFFKISPREAAWMDPQQRILLEIAHEAMEDAGIPADKLAGTSCGVFVGISGMDYGQHALEDLASMTGHTMTGNTLSIAANRLSYYYDLRGPSLAMDTACSSGLAAVHQACQALRNGEVPIALAGGVNLLMHPYSFIGFSHASMLSAKGQCRPFDAAGDGYVRGEGAALFLLKPLAKAIADGDRIHAVIVGSGVNSDGARKNGLTIPSEEAQLSLMRDILAQSGLDSGDIDYVEAHGTGTPAGDPVEARSIGRAYGRDRDEPLPISSAKANFGHLEPASGMVGLVKAILAIKHGEVPPMPLEFTPNPKIDFQALHIVCAANGQMLRRGDGRPLTAAVNSFGFGGLNAHVLVSGFFNQQTYSVPNDTIPPLFLSADNDKALREMAGAYASRLEGLTKGDYYNLAYGAAFRRDRMEKKLAIWADDIPSVREALRACANGESSRGVAMESSTGNVDGVAFIYSGNGSQWHGMGRALYEESSAFAEIMSALDAGMAPLLGYSIIQMLLDGDPKKLEDTAISQPLLFALQVGITSLLRGMGIKPMAVAGHSVGEVAAAWAAGALSLGQAIQVIHARSLVQSRTFGLGKMAAMAVSAERALEIIHELGLEGNVEVAACNSPGNCTISGEGAGLRLIQEFARENNHFFKLLDLEYAFHSRQMDMVKKDLEELLSGIEPVGEGDAIFVSTVTGSEMDGAQATWEYWWRNIREPVNFRGAIGSLATLGAHIFVEIGPHPVLQRYIRENISEAEAVRRVMPTLQRGNPGLARLRNVAASIHLLVGRDQLVPLFPHKGAHCPLPFYPWQKQSCWYPRTSEELPQTRRRQPLAGWPLPGNDPLWENIFDPRKDTWLADHKVGGVIVFPAAGYMELALEAARAWLGSEKVGFEDFDILLPLIFEGSHAQCVRCSINAATGFLRITSRPRLDDGQWLEHAHCRIISSGSPHAIQERASEKSHDMDAAELYALTAELGLEYGPTFQRIEKIKLGTNQLEAVLSQSPGQGWVLDPAVLDACFHSLAPLYAAPGHHMPYLPVGAKSLRRHSSADVVFIRGTARKGASRVLHADFELFDARGNLVATALDCRFRPAPAVGEGEGKVDCWQTSSWLNPLAKNSEDKFELATLLKQATGNLADLEPDRSLWHREILPRLEALVIAGLAGVLSGIKDPGDGTREPYILWMRNLLRDEGLGDNESGARENAQSGDLPDWLELWRETYALAPHFLPALLPLARVLSALPNLAKGELDSETLLNMVRAEAIASEYSALNPAYAGTEAMISEIMALVASDWPASKKLKVLDLGAWPGNAMRTLLETLSPDRFSCTAILSGNNSARKPEFPMGADCDIIGADPFQWLREQPADAKFDVIILRQILHRADNLSQSVDKLHELLIPGGILILAERYADWSADIVDGLDPRWWQTVENGAPVSSRMHPEAWEKILSEHGFEECVVHKESADAGFEEGAFLVLARKNGTFENDVQLPAGSWSWVVDEENGAFAEKMKAIMRQSGDQSSDGGEKEPVSNVLFMSAVREPAETSGALELLAQCAVQCAETEKFLWIVTRGGALFSTGSGGDVCPAQSAIAGFGRVIQNEFPDLRCRLIDIAPELSDEDACAVLLEEMAKSEGPDEIVRDGSGRHGARVLAARDNFSASVGRCVLRIAHPGRLDNLAWEKLESATPGAGDVEVRVMATGLNFRDVMLSMGLLPEDVLENGFAGPTLGLEFSGIVTAVGADVKDFVPGDRVAGFAASCFSSHVLAPAHALTHIPDNIKFAAAAALPTVFITAWYALKHLARLRPGESVLIHGGAGGVGLAAIQIAKYLGAAIYVTAGTPEKRAFMECLGVDGIFDSRNLDFFDEIMACTAGRGVDVVLNSLAGEPMRRSMALLKPFGRFLELGKRDYVENTAVGLRPLRENISYFSIDVDQLLTARPELASELYREVFARLADGTFSPIPYRVFPASRVVDAFRTMQQARHMGKLVVDMSAPPSIPFENGIQMPDFSGTWLVSGGLGGFGLATARHLAACGVKNLALASRRGPHTPDVESICAEFAAQGVNAVPFACDFADAGAVLKLIKEISETLPPLTGVVHAAAVFDDSLLSRLDRASFDRVLNPKFIGAWNLHEAVRELPLKHFVLYSSISVALGNPGQGNYVAANAGQEAIVRLRLRQGLPATCIAWGPIADVGYLARNEAVRRNLSSRLGVQLSAKMAMRMFNKAVAAGGMHIIANMDWNAALRMMDIPAPRFTFLMEKTGKNACSGVSENMRERLGTMEPGAAKEELRQCIVQETARVLGLNVENIPAGRNLQSMGLDSLMAMELALGLEHRTGLRLPPMLLQDAPTIDQLAERLLERVGADGENERRNDVLLADLARKHSESLAPEETRDVLTMLEGARK